MKTMSKLAIALVGVAGLALAAESAQAQTVIANGTGSSAGRLFASQTPSFVCDASPTPLYFKDTGNPPNMTEWQCKRGGVNHIYRYSATGSADGFLKQPNGAVATATYLVTSGCPAGTSTTIAGHTVLQSVCPAGTPTTTLPVHFGASDTKATSFHQTGNGVSIVPPASGHLTTTPVVAVPFTLVVGPNVRGKDSAGNLTTLLSITEEQARQILAGLVTDWTILGLDTTTANKTITTCQRTPGSGTLATLDEVIMRPNFWVGGINPATTASSPNNIWNPSSSNVKSCVENNPNAIGYIDSDTVPNLLNGAYQIGISGQVVNAGALGTGAARMKDLRCGRYIYWADWNIVTRNAGVEVAPVNAVAGTNAAIQAFVDQATLNNPLPDYWVAQNDMFVFKNDDRGPFNWFTPSGNGEDAATVCKKAGSTL